MSENSLLAELEWRGLISQTTDRKELSEALDKKPLTLYVGFDPTAPSLHVGNLVVLLALRRFQLAGHRPIALVGGATGLVGDPSGRSDERTLNEEATVKEWVERIRKQVSKFIDFDLTPNGALVANNLDWTAPLSAIEFLRDIGKHFSVNLMLSKDSVSSRLESNGISYTEFSYQVLQSYDFLELFRRENCVLQIGGSDQWGNITAGLDLIRRVTGGSAHALTIPLLAKADGSKFGKTASGSIWLDPELTSPYAFYQYWFNSDDKDVIPFIKVFTFASREETSELEKEVNENPGARNAQRYLACELTSLVHSPEVIERIELVSKALFGQGELSEVDLETLASAANQLPNTVIEGEFPSVIDLFHAAGIVESKSAARRLIKEGGAYINNQRVADESAIPAESELIHGRYLILRKGKKELGVVIRG
jgi:tyrosyl-tRNA synthetase